MQGSGSLEQLVLYPCKLPNYDYITGILNLSSLKKTNQLLHNISSFLPLTQLPPCLAAGLKKTDINNCLVILHTGKREVSKISKPPLFEAAIVFIFQYKKLRQKLKWVLKITLEDSWGLRAECGHLTLLLAVQSSPLPPVFFLYRDLKQVGSPPWYSLANKTPLQTPSLC